MQDLDPDEVAEIVLTIKRGENIGRHAPWIQSISIRRADGKKHTIRVASNWSYTDLCQRIGRELLDIRDAKSVNDAHLTNNPAA